MNSISPTFTQVVWLNEFIQILLYFLSAYLISLLLSKVFDRVLILGHMARKERKSSLERQKTLKSLVSNAIKILALLIASLASLGRYIETDTLAWIFGLFSAAFGLGARPIISDYLTGLSFIFEDTFAVGEKIELPGQFPMEGVVESVNMRTTLFRASSGELFVVPNGEIRSIRNFSRGKFSITSITIKIPSPKVGATVTILEGLGDEAVYLLPNLIEPWQIISPKGFIGESTELTIVAKARFGKAAEMRPRLLTLVHAKLDEEGISLTD